MIKRTVIISAIVFFVFISTLIFEVFLATKGEREDFRNPPNEPRFFGEGGKKLTYLVIGDSTSAGQGGDYEKGVAVSSAKYLGNNYKVEMINFSVSGATVEDVKNNQLNKALQYVPDIVLISAGSNDVTHLSSTSKIKNRIPTK